MSLIAACRVPNSSDSGTSRSGNDGVRICEPRTIHRTWACTTSGS
jgi:hypothetical protein